jgi:hypothetical protein
MLSENDYKLTIDALESLSSRHPHITEQCNAIVHKLGRDEILWGIERNLLALALQGYVMIVSLGSYEDVDRIARELSISEELIGLRSVWITWATK